MGKLFNQKLQNETRKKLRREMPTAEVILWLRLKGRQMNCYKFHRQFGVSRYIVDFYCPELKLAIEIDGPSHDEDDVTVYDTERQRGIESLGIRILRFRNIDVYTNIDQVLKTIKNSIE